MSYWIWHGLEPKLTCGKLYIKVEEREKFILFEVKDDGVGIDKLTLERINRESDDSSIRSFIGLKNVYKKLKIYYGDECSFKIESEEGIGTKIYFRLPL